MISDPHKAVLTVHIDKSGPTISKHIYGHFAEHLGRCIYGGFFVGENSVIQNTNGIRNDVLAALANIKIPNLRWPGGCFADTYHWKDGIGPRSSRPAIVNRWWGNVTEDNSFGTHDFLQLCELLNAEPYITANLGSGSVAELMDWVQYTNFDGVSPMSDLRKKNGREKPWGVKFWGLGNEAWGCGGNMTASYYVNVYRQYATFMSGWSNTENLFRIASGANINDYAWTETLMRDIPHRLMEGISMHYYAVSDWNRRGNAAQFSIDDYFSSVAAALRIDELIFEHRKIMDRYDSHCNVGLVIDEWGTWYDVEPGTEPGFLYQENTMRDAIVAAVTLNIFNKHAGRVKMANIAQTINVLQALIYTNGEHLWLSPTYFVFDFFKQHQGNILVQTELECKMISSSDIPVPSISVSASANLNDGEVVITLANLDPHETVSLEVLIDGPRIGTVSSRLLSSDKLSDHNSAQIKNNVKPVSLDDIIIQENKFLLSMPPASIMSCVIK
jgi:alpha-N-arabinofuranosidase